MQIGIRVFFRKKYAPDWLGDFRTLTSMGRGKWMRRILLEQRLPKRFSTLMFSWNLCFIKPPTFETMPLGLDRETWNTKAVSEMICEACKTIKIDGTPVFRPIDRVCCPNLWWEPIGSHKKATPIQLWNTNYWKPTSINMLAQNESLDLNGTASPVELWNNVTEDAEGDWINGTETTTESIYYITPPSDPSLLNCVNIMLKSDIKVI